MASIRNASIFEVQQIGSDILLFKVKYNVRFSKNEIGLFFDDAVKLWEADVGDGDPFSGGNNELMPYPFPQTFKAEGKEVPRVSQLTCYRNTANTESGDEEIKAQIWLRRSGSTGAANSEVFTPWTTVAA